MPMLKKMKMPKREEISVDELDMEMPEGEEMSDELAGESEGESGEAPSMAEGEMADLTAISDEDLLAEIKKRGLMGALGEEMTGEEEVENEDEMYS